jgi:hypothetical protein
VPDRDLEFSIVRSEQSIRVGAGFDDLQRGRIAAPPELNVRIVAANERATCRVGIRVHRIDGMADAREVGRAAGLKINDVKVLDAIANLRAAGEISI